MPRVRRGSRFDLQVTSENDWKIKKLTQGFILDDIKILKLQRILASEMQNGMSAKEAVRNTSSLRMEVTHVRDILDGTEHGEYLALDLGGTNFRVMFVTLNNGKLVTKAVQRFEVPYEFLVSTAEELFMFIAQCIDNFLSKENIPKPSFSAKLPLGLTFSFPMTHQNINSGILLTWTKNFRNTSGIGMDPAEMLQNCLNEKSLPVEVVALINDTVGTMMCGTLLHSNCLIGLILGTGSNVCYMERLRSDIEDYKCPPGKLPPGPPQVIINTEWGAFGDNGCVDFLKTDFDRQVELLSNHVGSYTFEKLFSGLYLGELVRLTLVHLCTEGLIFKGEASERLLTPGGFPTSYISRVESDNHRDLSNTFSVLRDLELKNTDEEDYHVVRYLVNILSIRAAQIIASGLAVVIQHIKVSNVCVAVDGSLYQHHPKLCTFIQEYLEIYVPTTKVSFIESADGSGKGAALTAAMACRLRDSMASSDDDCALPTCFMRQLSRGINLQDETRKVQDDDDDDI